MPRLLPALCAVALAMPLASPPAQAGALGVSYAVGLTEPLAPTNLNAYQQGSGFAYRSTALTPWTEWAIGITSRGQVLAPDRTYVFETSGLKADAGVVVGPLRAGMGLELALLRQIVGEPGGTVRWHNGGGFIAEPYLGVMLPGGGLKRGTFEVSVHYPLPQLRVDPALGPRVMLTMWLSGRDEDEEAGDQQESGGAPSPAPNSPPSPSGKKPRRPDL